MASTERRVLLAPAAVARAAARMAKAPEQRWMLVQPPAVRRSYVLEVLDHADEPGAEELWMLRQTRPVRLSFVRDVLARRDPPPRQEMWMLRQNDAVRASYVREVLEPDTAANEGAPG